MPEPDEIIRIEVIKKKILAIETIVQQYGSIAKVLEDALLARPAILMHLVSIAEQVSKLQKQNSHLLEHFDPNDVKGLCAMRNFITHDYEDVKLSVVETVLSKHLPILKTVVLEILQKNTRCQTN